MSKIERNNTEKIEKRYTMKQFARLIGVSISTISRWNKTGKLKCKHNIYNNQPYYTLEDYLHYKKFIKENETIRITRKNARPKNPLDEPVLTFTWTKRDIAQVLEEHHIPPTDENIDAYLYEFHRHDSHIYEIWDGVIRKQTTPYCLNNGYYRDENDEVHQISTEHVRHLNIPIRIHYKLMRNKIYRIENIVNHTVEDLLCQPYGQINIDDIRLIQEAIKDFTDKEMLHSVYITENLVEPLIKYFKSNNEAKRILIRKKDAKTPDEFLIYGTRLMIQAHIDDIAKRTHLVISKYDRDDIARILDEQNIRYDNDDIM